MDNLQRIARLEEAIELLHDVLNMFTSNQIHELSHSNIESNEGMRIEFLVKIASSLGILKDQLDYEMSSASTTTQRENTIQ